MGHAVRAAAVVRELAEAVPLRIAVIAGCDRRVWPASLERATGQWVGEPSDCGVVQSDDVTVDRAATARELAGWLADLDDILQRETARLRGQFDLMIGDVPAPAFEAAARAGIASVAVANFSWDWIYQELGFIEAARECARFYAKADVLLRATPFAPMPAFDNIVDVGLVARRPSSARAASRRARGFTDEQSVVLLAFQPASLPPLELPRRSSRRRFLVPSAWPQTHGRDDFVHLPASMSFEDAIAAADVIVGKPGYGLISDVDAAGARFLYVPRPGFPENTVLEQHLARRAGTASISAQDLASGGWEDALAALEAAERPLPADWAGASRAARAACSLLGIDWAPRVE
ncbi:MAG TPA: hypothetical protein VGK20_15560 [Candidatus Binatia bacterium]|jgi:L-arabinokinase